MFTIELPILILNCDNISPAGLVNLVLSFCNFANWCSRTIHLIQFSAFLNFQPLVGEEPNLIKNLQTFFELNYPKVRSQVFFRSLSFAHNFSYLC